MTNVIAQESIKAYCPHCSRWISSVWIMKYKSYKLTQYIYTCTNCQYIFKVTGKRFMNNMIFAGRSQQGIAHCMV